MRIAHVIQVLNTRAGGPLAVAGGLSRSLRAAGAEVSIVASAATIEPAAAERLRDGGVRVDVLRALTPAAIEAALADADVVHLHGVWDPIIRLAGRSVRRSGRPFVVTPHGMLTRWAIGQKAIKKRLYFTLFVRPLLDAASAIHLCSEFERRESVLAARWADRFFVERNGVELDEFRDLPAVGTFRAARHLGDRPLVVFLGRCHPGKGLEYLLPAMRHVRTPDALLLVVGPDPAGFGSGLATAAGAAADRVLFCGHLPGRARLEPLVDADVFALPSDHENFGVAIVEAAAAGCPVVISDQVGVADEVVAGGVGAVVPRDPVAVASAIDAWLSRRADRAATRTATNRWAVERFDYARVADEWITKYASIASRPMRHG